VAVKERRDVIVSPARLIDAAAALLESAAAAGYRGADPYDGLWWGWPTVLQGGRRCRQLLVQVHARTPIDIRRLYGRPPPLIPKALGAFGSVGMRVHRLTGRSSARSLGLEALELLAVDQTAGPVAWGYPWDVQTRWSFYPAGSPNVVATSFAAAGLLEAGRLHGREDFVDRARRAARWVVEELWVDPEGYFAYHPGRPVLIHNASLLGAWLAHIALADEVSQARVAQAIERTLAAQRPDGSWPYGDERDLRWADSFHTGYVLTCLARMRDLHGGIGAALERGAEHYRRFFDASGRARLWASRRFPEDGHSAGTGLSTLATLLRVGLAEPELLARVAARVLSAMLHRGHAVHRRYRWGRTTVRYVRWCDAHVALGLVDAAAALVGAVDPAPGPT
jgi:hypothetical protein